MTSGEFYNLLSSLMENTPLGYIAKIRSEENKDILKNFTPEQNSIRNEWRNKLMEKTRQKIAQMSPEERQNGNEMISKMIRDAFGKK